MGTLTVHSEWLERRQFKTMLAVGSFKGFSMKYDVWANTFLETTVNK